MFRRENVALAAPSARTLLASPYLLPFHPRTASGSIRSRLSSRALRNTKDNQPTTSPLESHTIPRSRADREPGEVDRPRALSRGPARAPVLAWLGHGWLFPRGKHPSVLGHISFSVRTRGQV